MSARFVHTGTEVHWQYHEQKIIKTGPDSEDGG